MWLRSTLVLFSFLFAAVPPNAAAQVPFQIETVDASGETGFGASIALDSHGQPHIAYIDRLSHTIRYRVKTGETWTAQPGPPYADERTGVTLVLDAADNPGIAHIGDFFRRVDGSWVVEYMGGFGPWFSTVAQDAAGGLQGVTIWSWGSGEYEGYVSYTTRIGDTWSDFILDDGVFYPSDPHASIVIDRHGDPHISLTPTGGDSVRYWHRSNGVWSKVVFTPGAWSSIVLDEQDSPRISYYDTVQRDLVLVFRQNGAWVRVRIDQSGDVGLYTSHEIRGGISHITYYAKTPGDLRYAVINPIGDTQGALIQTVDSDGDVGRWTSLVLDGQGLPHIAYQDAGNRYLKYATGSAGVPTKKETAGGIKWLYRR